MKHTPVFELRAGCSCGWQSDRVHDQADASAQHRAALVEFAAHKRKCMRREKTDA